MSDIRKPASLTCRLAPILFAAVVAVPATAEDLFPLATRSATVDEEPYTAGVSLGFLADEALPFSPNIPPHRDVLEMPLVRIVAPLGPRAVLRGEWPLVRVSDIEYPRVASSTTAPGDPRLEIQGPLFRDGWGGWNGGAILGIKIPSGSQASAVGTNQTDFLIGAAFSKEIVDIRLHLNAGLYIRDIPSYASNTLGALSGNAQDDQLRYGVAVSRPFRKSLFLAEIEGYAFSRFNNDFSHVRAGFRSPLLGTNWTLAASGAFGLTTESSGQELRIGFEREIR